MTRVNLNILEQSVPCILSLLNVEYLISPEQIEEFKGEDKRT